MRVDRLLHIVGCPVNKNLVATHCNLFSGEVYGTSFEIQNDLQKESLSVNIESWYQGADGANHLSPVLELSIGLDRATFPNCILKGVRYSGIAVAPEKVDLERLVPLLARITAQLRKGRNPDLSEIDAHLGRVQQ